MFLFCLLVSLACFSFACIGCSYYVSFLNVFLSGFYWSFLSIFDYTTYGVILMLYICFSYAYFYTDHYFSNSLAGFQLNYIICLFVAVMATLVLTGDMLSTLVLWEYLGVVSFFLILFYANYLSLRSSVITLVSSRFGDVCLFLLISVNIYIGYHPVYTLLLLFFIIFTKSAGFPFISWLLEAMRAPTPVSSLVHSSTLVAAGVWFSIRYDIFMLTNEVWNLYIFLLLTVFITGICCFYFLDLKKIVALSTCNNISWCLVYLLFGDVVLSLFQLVSHGVSKCLLFMLVGDVMSGSGGSQASNCVYSSSLYGNLGLFGLFSVVLGLSGAPFIGVFFTKHFLLSGFYNIVSVPCFAFLSFCVFLSYFYSFRLCRVIVNLNVSLVSGVMFSYSSGLMVYFWLIVNYFIAGLMDEVSCVGAITSLYLIISQLISCIISYFFFSSLMLSNWGSKLFGCDNLVELAYELFNYLKSFSIVFFFRWDNYSLSLFKGNISSVINIFNYNLLNITMISVILLLSIWCAMI